MKEPRKNLPTGWSFAAGTVTGALVAFVLLASLGIARLKAEPPRRDRATLALTSSAAGPAFAGVQSADGVAPPAQDPAASPAPASPGAQEKVPGHPELTLQLD